MTTHGIESFVATVFLGTVRSRSGHRVGCFFFFQAEDGIRDLVRSRGLGDVYKRQAFDAGRGVGNERQQGGTDGHKPAEARRCRAGTDPVSYTHLTLPTSDLV